MWFSVRASSVRFVRSISPMWRLAMLVLSLMAGCQKADEITRYKVEKMPPVERPERAVAQPGPPMRAHDRAANERLLGAIAQQGRTFWVFKVAGPKGSVAGQMPNFLSLVRSLKFAEDESLPPQWTLPEDWTERKESDPRSMRFATLLVKADGEDLPLTVMRIPVPAGRPIDGMPLMIVNLWCEQLGLPEKSAADLKSEQQPDGNEVQQLEVSGTPVTLVNFLASETPAARPPVASRGRPQWTVPDGWKETAGTRFSMAAFAVADGKQSVKMTVSRAGGDLLGNLNRWRDQVMLKPWSQGDAAKSVTSLSVDGNDGTFVDFVGTDKDSGKPTCLLGVIVPRGDEAWFFKLTGDVELAKREKENFEAFVQSVKFE